MKTISRSQAIADLRREFLKLVDADHSLCQVAARRGLFCNGFARFGTDELAERLPWRVPAGTARAEVERQANAWLSAVQDLAHGRLPCEGEVERGRLCAGWEEFFESELARFHREMCGDEVRVVPDVLLEPTVS